MNEDKTSWRDDFGLFEQIFSYFTLFVVILISIFQYVPVWFKLWLYFIIVLLFIDTLQRPIYIRNGEIVLAKDAFFLILRKKVNLNELVQIEITEPERWGEWNNPRSFFRYKLIKAIDKNGTKYRNLISQNRVEEFKEYMKINKPNLKVVDSSRGTQ